MASAASDLSSSKPPPHRGTIETFYRGWLMREDPLACTRRMAEQDGPVVGQHMGIFHSANLFGPDAMKMVLLNRDGIFSNKRAWDLIIGRIFTNGLMLRDGDDHRWHRNVMQAAFKKAALEEYVGRMNPRIAERLSHWEAGPRFRAYPALKRLTLDLAASVFLGLELGPESERLNRAFEDTVAASMAVVRLPIPGTPWQRGLAGRALMVEFFSKLVPQRRAGDGHDMLSQLCRAENDQGERYADQEIVDHMIFLMMAAHDTTTSALTSILYATARHPEWQEKIRRDSRALGAAQLGFDAADGMQTIALVMNEALRRWPPLSTFPRMATKDFEWMGHRIEAGTMVIVYPIHNHHMEEWWTEPFRFDPERFSDARAEHKRHSHLFVPFAGGAHMCIGLRFAELQIKAILHQLVQRFRWTLPKGYEMPVQQSPISKPKDGLPVILEAIA